MPPDRPKERTLLDTVKELDRLYELEADEYVRELIWQLLSDVQEYRRKQDRDRKQAG